MPKWYGLQGLIIIIQASNNARTAYAFQYRYQLYRGCHTVQALRMACPSRLDKSNCWTAI
jgi:hypothetical protein